MSPAVLLSQKPTVLEVGAIGIQERPRPCHLQRLRLRSEQPPDWTVGRVEWISRVGMCEVANRSQGAEPDESPTHKEPITLQLSIIVNLRSNCITFGHCGESLSFCIPRLKRLARQMVADFFIRPPKKGKIGIQE